MADVSVATVEAHLKPYNLMPGILGEAVLTAWLLTKGVNVELWRPGQAHGLESHINRAAGCASRCARPSAMAS